jgi:hypothetical protein
MLLVAVSGRSCRAPDLIFEADYAAAKRLREMPVG